MIPVPSIIKLLNVSATDDNDAARSLRHFATIFQTLRAIGEGARNFAPARICGARRSHLIEIRSGHHGRNGSGRVCRIWEGAGALRGAANESRGEVCNKPEGQN